MWFRVSKEFVFGLPIAPGARGLASTPAWSWPHAPEMSRPRVRRIVALTPCAWRASRKARNRRRGVVRYKEPGYGLNGIRLTWHRCPRSKTARSTACPTESFTPSSIVYSYVTRLRTRRWNRELTAINSSRGKRFAIGTSVALRSSTGAWSEIARPTGKFQSN